jgi:hypothetical protein
MANNGAAQLRARTSSYPSRIMVGNRRHIPEPTKQQWVMMSTLMKSSDIARVTHSSHRTVNRALRLSRFTGSVVQRPLQAGRPRLLTALDAAVSHAVACVALLASSSHIIIIRRARAPRHHPHCVGLSVRAKFLFDGDKLDSQGY